MAKHFCCGFIYCHCHRKVVVRACAWEYRRGLVFKSSQPFHPGRRATLHLLRIWELLMLNNARNSSNLFHILLSFFQVHSMHVIHMEPKLGTQIWITASMAREARRPLRREYEKMNKWQSTKSSVVNNCAMDSTGLSEKHFLFLEMSTNTRFITAGVKSSVGRGRAFRFCSWSCHGRAETPWMKSSVPLPNYPTQTPNYVCLYFKKTH